MSATRLDQLSEIVKQNPGNVLARYGLAMDYAQQGDNAKSIETVRGLIADNPSYIAAYYQAGRVLQKIGEVQQARDVFNQGIAAAHRAGDLHAQGELQAALAELG